MSYSLLTAFSLCSLHELLIASRSRHQTLSRLSTTITNPQNILHRVENLLRHHKSWQDAPISPSEIHSSESPCLLTTLTEANLLPHSPSFVLNRHISGNNQPINVLRLAVFLSSQELLL